VLPQQHTGCIVEIGTETNNNRARNQGSLYLYRKGKFSIQLNTYLTNSPSDLNFNSRSNKGNAQKQTEDNMQTQQINPAPKQSNLSQLPLISETEEIRIEDVALQMKLQERGKDQMDLSQVLPVQWDHLQFFPCSRNPTSKAG
jgi:hypothetical protein